MGMMADISKFKNMQRNMSILTIDEISSMIRPILEKYDVEKAYLFGSYARHEATVESDVDIRIEKGQSTKLKGLFQVGSLQLDLMDVLQKKVDLITVLPESERYRILNDNIHADEVLLYEAT